MQARNKILVFNEIYSHTLAQLTGLQLNRGQGVKGADDCVVLATFVDDSSTTRVEAEAATTAATTSNVKN